ARETALSFRNLRLSPTTARAPAELNIDLDAPLVEDGGATDGAGAAPASAPRAMRDPRRAELGRRDSLKRREALLKGKAGTRRRQRWENGTPTSSVTASTSTGGFSLFAGLLT